MPHGMGPLTEALAVELTREADARVFTEGKGKSSAPLPFANLISHLFPRPWMYIHRKQAAMHARECPPHDNLAVAQFGSIRSCPACRSRPAIAGNRRGLPSHGPRGQRVAGFPRTRPIGHAEIDVRSSTGRRAAFDHELAFDRPRESRKREKDRFWQFAR